MVDAPRDEEFSEEFQIDEEPMVLDYLTSCLNGLRTATEIVDQFENIKLLTYDESSALRSRLRLAWKVASDEIQTLRSEAKHRERPLK